MTTNNTSLTKVSRGTLEKENLIEVQSERVEMTLNTDSAIASGLLIQRLTELYEDPIEASVRETVSNALDAVTESFSGERAEVNIIKPTSLNPVFTVKDNGVGMTYDDLKEIYSKYGASTKMNNFEQIGAYGLGAKAPLAYGTEFTVSSVKNGQKTTIIVAREELTNYIKIIDSCETNEPSGTTVSIPVAHYDVEKFIENIEKYENSPVDNSKVALLVDGEELENKNFIQVADDVVIFNRDGEEVKARLWIKNSPGLIVDFMTGMSEASVRSSLNYLIGGWTYQTPIARGYMGRNNQKSIIVELKPGIVGFNSSRDAILGNERYNELEKLVIDYMKSPSFVNNLIKEVNKLDLVSFNNVLKSIMGNNSHAIKFIENPMNPNSALKVKFSMGSYSTIISSYELSDLVHEETGLSLNKLFGSAPSKQKKLFVAEQNKANYKKSVSNSVLTNRSTKETLVPTSLKYNIKDINIMFAETFSGEKKSLNYEQLLCYLMLYSDSDVYLTFITDVDTTEDPNDKTTDICKVRSARATISKMRVGENVNEFRSYIIYTENTKSEIENMMKTSMFDKTMNLKVYTVKETIDEISKYRKENNTSSSSSSKSKTKKEEFSTLLFKLDDKKLENERIEVDELEVKDDVKNLIILSKNRNSAIELLYIKNWYCNKYKVPKDSVQLYLSIGQHRISELKTLSEFGELHLAPYSEDVSNSNLYKEIVERNELEFNYFMDNDPELKTKVLLYLFNEIKNYTSRWNNNIVRLIKEHLEEYSKIAKEVNVHLEDVPVKELDYLIEFEKNNPDLRLIRHTTGNKDSHRRKHLIASATDEQIKFIENLTATSVFNSIVNLKSGEFKFISNRSDTNRFDKTSIIECYKDENKDNAAFGLQRQQFEVYVNYLNQLIKDFLNLKLV